MKKLLLLPCAIVVCALCGCMKTVQLNERLLVQGFGVDYYADSYTITVSAFAPHRAGTEQRSSTEIFEATAPSITEALDKIEGQSGKEIFLGSNRFVVMSLDGAEYRMAQVVDFLTGNHQLRPKTMLLLSRSPAADIVSAELTGADIPAQVLQNTVSIATQNGSCFDSTIMSVSTAFESKGESAPITYIDIGEDKERKTAQVLGAVVMSQNTIKTQLTPEQCRGAQWISGTVEQSTMRLADDKGNRYTVKVKPMLHVLTAQMGEENTPELLVRMTANCTVTEAIAANGTGVKNIDLKEVQKMAEDGIRSEAALAVDELFWQNQSDIYHTQKLLEKYCKEFYFTHENDMENVYSNIKLNVKTNANISCAPILGGTVVS